jgi:hypothetical protein
MQSEEWRNLLHKLERQKEYELGKIYDRFISIGFDVSPFMLYLYMYDDLRNIMIIKK